ncbi:contactin-6-like [Trichoplusia ni]|uniref:Contactin-6-like n=1 Tax=Trichoplusia ni TaxID=7111 RepID=A0A7E5W6Q0_TRINI|nr:contactin-6-like [Trichoplusia ni]
MTTGDLKPTITWKVDGATITPSSKYTIKNGELVIYFPKQNDSKIYVCEAQNYLGTHSAEFQVQIDVPEIHKIRPVVNIEEGQRTEVDYDGMVKLSCKVSSYPEPKISWMNAKGTVAKSESSTLIAPYDYISYITISNITKADKYKCYAVNNIGSDEKVIDVDVKDAFDVKSVPEGTTGVLYDSEGIITCDITSKHLMNIRWYYADEITRIDREISSSELYQISRGGKQLKIMKMNLNLVGKYTCKATLQNHRDVQKIFSTRVKADGLGECY